MQLWLPESAKYPAVQFVQLLLLAGATDPIGQSGHVVEPNVLYDPGPQSLQFPLKTNWPAGQLHLLAVRQADGVSGRGHLRSVFPPDSTQTRRPPGRENFEIVPDSALLEMSSTARFSKLSNLSVNAFVKLLPCPSLRAASRRRKEMPHQTALG